MKMFALAAVGNLLEALKYFSFCFSSYEKNHGGTSSTSN